MVGKIGYNTVNNTPLVTSFFTVALAAILQSMHRHTISFVNAFRGIWTAIITQANIRIHLVIGSLVLFAAVYLRISLDHILDLFLVIALVMVTEMINTSLEFLSDSVTLEHREYIGHAKDVSAGAVLIAAIFAILIGLITFIPPIMAL